MPDPKMVTVVPSPRLAPTEYVRGVPAAGRVMSSDEAKPLLDAGLVVVKEPPASPAKRKKEAE